MRPALAAQPEANECPAFTAVEPLPLDDCGAVFEAAPPIDAAELWREIGIEEVAAQTHAIDLVYRGSLDEPTPISFVDLTLLATDEREACTPVALLEIAVTQPVESCSAGAYVVTAGTSLGTQGRVVAILDNLLLLAWQGELRYLTTNATDEPSWRMIWHPPWRLSRPHQATPSPPPRHQPRPGRRR